MGTVSDLVTEITTNVDTSPADALTVLDRRHKLMCARARWHRLSQTIAVSTATDATYSTLAAPDLVEAFAISRDRQRLRRQLPADRGWGPGRDPRRDLAGPRPRRRVPRE
jgi:hypothetical protein